MKIRKCTECGATRRLGDRSCPWCEHEFPNSGLHGELLGCDGSYMIRGVCQCCGWERSNLRATPSRPKV
jgi:hypothetical protein